MLSTLGKGALMGKVDLKSAFRMVPVRRQDWELLGIKWKEAYYVDTCLPFGLGFGSTCLPKPSNGSHNTTRGYSGFSTIG